MQDSRVNVPLDASTSIVSEKPPQKIGREGAKSFVIKTTFLNLLFGMCAVGALVLIGILGPNRTQELFSNYYRDQLDPLPIVSYVVLPITFILLAIPQVSRKKYVGFILYFVILIPTWTYFVIRLVPIVID